MNLALHRIQELYPIWNHRFLTEKDFFRICDKRNVEVLWDKTNSFCFRLLGEDFICLNQNLRGQELLFDMFHELSHQILHIPYWRKTAVYFNNPHGEDSKHHLEANVLALLAMYPIKQIGRWRFDESSQYLDKRLKIYEVFRI